MRKVDLNELLLPRTTTEKALNKRLNRLMLLWRDNLLNTVKQLTKPPSFSPGFRGECPTVDNDGITTI